MKTQNLKKTITLFSMLLCIGVFAQGPPGGQGGRGGGQKGQQRSDRQPDASQILSKLDSNNDDKIDKDEASKDKRGKISEDFDQIDSNDDGFIDLDELEASLNGKKPKGMSPKKLIKTIDDNGDGTLNELEVAAKEEIHLSNNFKTIDTNNDGELDLKELEAFLANQEKPKREKRD
tara:strand:+ start:205 stop:732 length:528 start_codon:yes stop_codon:yes gene_type:complete